MSDSLLRWEPTLAEKADISGRTALHYAASAGKIGVVKLLLGNGSLAYIPDTDGLFPVHVAAITNKSKVILQFMKMCPGCDELVDKKHRNILHCAVEHGSIKVVWHFCRDPKFVSNMINSGDSEGNTPLHLAVKHGRGMIFSLLMMDMRVNLGNINHEGLTPLLVVWNENNQLFIFVGVSLVHYAIP
jgi:ankyrin repeat protein